MLDLLRKVHWFSGLDECRLNKIGELTHQETFAGGECLYREGGDSDKVFIIESGEVSVMRHLSGGSPVQVARLGCGDIAGLIGLLHQRPRLTTAKALQSTKAWTIEQRELEELLVADGVICREMLRFATQHVIREGLIATEFQSQHTDKGMRVAFFHSTSFNNELYSKRNSFNWTLHFFAPRLTLDTATLAMGCRAVVVGNDTLNAPVLEELHSLGVELIALRSAGFENVDLDACQRLRLSVARVPAYSPHAIAEHAVALMMALNRKTHLAHNRIREGNFSLLGLSGFNMHGRTAGIVGTGRIGSCLAPILHGFGCRIIAYCTSPDPELSRKYGVEYVEFRRLLEQSDIISLHVPLDPSTYHMINADTIRQMKPGVMLINTARGGVVDTSALLDGLKSGLIGFAGLDVYEEERDYFFEDHSASIISDDSLARLMTFNNVMVTSHQAWLTDVAQTSIVEITFENIREFELGKRGMQMTNTILNGH